MHGLGPMCMVGGGGQELQNTNSSENEIWTLKGPKNSAQAGGTLIFHVAKVVRVVLKVPWAKTEDFAPLTTHPRLKPIYRFKNSMTVISIPDILWHCN